MRNKLVVQGNRERLGQLIRIVRLEKALRAVVERAVSQRQTQATRRQVVAVRARQIALRERNTYPVVLTMPTRPGQLRADRKKPVGLREAETFGRAVVPA